MKKMMIALFAGLFSASLLAGIASAHVVVYPKQTTQGTYEKFTVRVPTEKDVPTVKVEVKIPDGVDISGLEPVPDWKYETQKDATGKITDVTWTATGQGLAPAEFGEFNMQGKVSDTAVSLSWKAYQTYQDGSVVEWVESAGSDHPASVTVVNAPSEAGAADGAASNSSLPLYLSIAALVIGILALIAALVRRRA